MEISKLKPLLKIEFNVTETLQLLSYNKPIFWSWGVSSMINIANKGLLLNVSGNHHKGLVLVTLNGQDLDGVQKEESKQELFANGERVYLKEDNNVSQVVDDNTKDWSLWERLPKQETNLKKHLDSCEEYQGPRRGANDTYTVYILSMCKTVLNTFENIYFDQLVEVIDNRIEKIKDYVY